MKKLLNLKTLLGVLFLTTLTLIAAETEKVEAGSIVFHYDEQNGDITESGKLEKDYFAGGETLSFTGMGDDVYLMGSLLNFDGTSENSLIALGNTVEITGNVGNNTYSAGNTVRVSGTLNDTAFLAGEHIIISKEAVVEGTLLSGSNTLHIMGPLNNGFISGAGEIIIDGPVTGDVRAYTGKIIITERGSVTGNLIYSAKSELTPEEASRITGTITFQDEDHLDEAGLTKFAIIAVVIFFLSLLVSGVLLLFLPGLKALFSEGEINFGKTALWGLIPVLVFPVITLFAIPLFPLSIAMGLAIFPLMGLTTIFGLALAGKLLFNKLGRDKNVHICFLAAFGIYVVVSLIPVIKVFAILGVMALGAGMILMKLFKVRF